jgi:GntR family transcriptional regulator / MocR family aminotransferase
LVVGTLPAVDLHVSLVGRVGLAGEIYRQLRDAILDGRLRPGDRLPPGRELARRLNVSRTTVTVAYDRLSGEGFVTSRVGAGTFVSNDAHRPASPNRRTGDALRPRAVWRSIPVPPPFTEPPRFDFRPGSPDSALFPYETWRRLIARELRASAGDHGFYGDPAGHLGLREAIARHIGTSRGLATTPVDITITNGTQQGLDLVARVLLAPGDRVAVEDPGFRPQRLLFASLDLEVIGVPVDREGIVVDALPDDARLVYVTPSHQYPLGVSMSLARRTALLEWADRHHAAIVEDDYDTEFRYTGRPVEPLQTLDASGCVIYVGSFSRTMLPTLRLGFVVTPSSLTEALHAARFVTDWHSSLPTQMALARFIDQGRLARHIRRMRAVYHERHEKVVEGVVTELSEHLTLVPSAAGLHLSTMANGVSADELDDVVARAAAAGVVVPPLARYCVDRPAQSGLVLGFGGIDAARIDEGLHLLRQSFQRR